MLKFGPSRLQLLPGLGEPLPPRARGFTLIELLVVVALIGILAGVVGFSIKGGGQGQALSNSQRNVLAMIEAAKANAQLQGTRARFIVFADKNVVSANSASAAIINNKILRYYGVIYAFSDDPTLTTQAGLVGKPFLTWGAPSGAGAFLPDGIYFLPSHPTTFSTDLPSFASINNAINDQYGDPGMQQTSYDIHPGTTTGLMQLEYPVAQAVEGEGGDFFYFIEFAPDGFYYNVNGNNNIIIGSATNASTTSIDFGGEKNVMFTGIQLRTLGGAAPFRSTADFKPKN